MLLERSHVLVLLLASLEASMAVLGGGVDELDADLLHEGAGGLRRHWPSQGDGALDRTAD